jgi:hypothetical protein
MQIGRSLSSVTPSLPYPFYDFPPCCVQVNPSKNSSLNNAFLRFAKFVTTLFQTHTCLPVYENLLSRCKKIFYVLRIITLNSSLCIFKAESPLSVRILTLPVDVDFNRRFFGGREDECSELKWCSGRDSDPGRRLSSLKPERPASAAYLRLYCRPVARS